MKSLLKLTALLGLMLTTNGCVVLAAAGAGVLAHDEATEKDGEFDPLEKVEDALDDGDKK